MIIDDNYEIIKDGDCIILRYESKVLSQLTNKMITSKDTWYFPNVKLALKKYLNQKVDASDEISNILEAIEKVEEKIDNLKL